MKNPHEVTKQRRRAVLRTAWLLVALVIGIYLFFIGRAFLEGGL